jgi:hypothetical protein
VLHGFAFKKWPVESLQDSLKESKERKPELVYHLSYCAALHLKGPESFSSKLSAIQVHTSIHLSLSLSLSLDLSFSLSLGDNGI